MAAFRLLLICLILSVLIPMTVNGEVRLVSSVIGGGAVGAAGSAVTVGSTLGQPVVQHVSGVTLSLHSGFWTGGNSAIGVPGGNLPPRLHLLQNSPNPFMRATTIGYRLPEGVMSVRLRVFHPDGRLVRTLLDGPASSGAASVSWAGTDDAGRAVAAGVYFYRLEVDGREYRRKMVLID